MGLKHFTWETPSLRLQVSMASNVAHKQLICDAHLDAYDYMHVLMSCYMHIYATEDQRNIS